MIYLAINTNSGYMEMIFDNYEDALRWTNRQTEMTGDLYVIDEEEEC